MDLIDLTFRGRPFIILGRFLRGKQTVAKILYTDNGQRTTLAQYLVDGAKRRRKGDAMKALIVLCMIALVGCGTVEIPSNLASTATETSTSTATATSTSTAADPRQGGTTVEVTTQTTVEIDNSAAADAGSGSANSRLVKFADGSYGNFFDDGTFDHGYSAELDETAPASCMYATPDCSGTCYVEHRPAQSSIFGNGSAMWLASGDETDRGQMVTCSTWNNGQCVAKVRTVEHSYQLQMGWTAPAGESGAAQ